MLRVLHSSAVSLRGSSTSSVAFASALDGSMHSCFTQGSHAYRTAAHLNSSSMQRAAAALQRHAGVMQQPRRIMDRAVAAAAATTAAAACRTHRSQACLQSQLTLHHAAHHTACAATSNSCFTSTAAASSPSRSLTRLTRCHSTLNPAAGPSGPGNISWLCEVQAWPSQAAHSQATSSNSSSSGTIKGTTNGNGSAAGNGGPGDDAADSLYSISSEQDFTVLQAADLSSMQFDAIVVLAGGLLPDGDLPSWAQRRLDVARDLHMMLGRTAPILCSGGGTPHKPSILGSNGHVLHESTAMASYLMASGVAPGDIFKETASYDTVGNTYFSLAIHALPAAWTRLAVVTSDFHMLRSRALFADIYRLAGSSLFGDPHRFSLTFLSASDEGCFDEYVHSARLQKEAASLAHWQGVAAGLHSLPELQAWLHSDHLCYAVQRQHEFGQRTIKDQKLLESY